MSAKTNLFLLSGLASLFCGSEDLRKQGGLYRNRPFLALLFLISALALAGVPPLSGFFAKLLVLTAAVETQSWICVFVALAVGLGTLFSMVKIWTESFWKPMPEFVERSKKVDVIPICPILGIALLACVTVALGLGSSFVFQVCERAADELLNQEKYIRAVLGEG